MNSYRATTNNPEDVSVLVESMKIVFMLIFPDVYGLINGLDEEIDPTAVVIFRAIVVVVTLIIVEIALITKPVIWILGVFVHIARFFFGDILLIWGNKLRELT